MNSKILLIKDFEKILRQSWSKDTCYEIFQKDWNEKLPELGQCYISARLFQEFFGGEILKVKDINNESHFLNILNGVEYDFTINQYKNGKDDLRLENIKITKEDSINERLSMLREKFNSIRQKL